MSRDPLSHARHDPCAHGALRSAGLTPLVLLALAGLCVAAHAQDTVYLRGQREPLRGLVTNVGPAGLAIRVATPGSDAPASPPAGGATPPAPSSPGGGGATPSPGAAAGAVGGGVGGAASELIALDRVRRVDGPNAALFDNWSTRAEALWRARTRVERGDMALGEEALASLYPPSRPGDLVGPTGQTIAELALRLRLARGWTPGALAAWFDTFNTRRQSTLAPREGASTTQSPTQSTPQLPTQSPRLLGAAVIDPTTGLVPSLPPIFSPALHNRWLGAVIDGPTLAPTPSDDPSTRELRELYKAAASAELAGLPSADSGAPFPTATTSDPGVQFVREIVVARLGDPAQRLEAREKLGRRLSSLASGRPRDATPRPDPEWVDAWCRVAIGRSLLREADPQLRRAGVLSLLHVPARFDRSFPELARLSLLDAADALERDADSASAAKLRALARPDESAAAGPTSVPKPTHEDPPATPAP
jgi:hypothetical protein